MIGPPSGTAQDRPSHRGLSQPARPLVSLRRLVHDRQGPRAGDADAPAALRVPETRRRARRTEAAWGAGPARRRARGRHRLADGHGPAPGRTGSAREHPGSCRAPGHQPAAGRCGAHRRRHDADRARRARGPGPVAADAPAGAPRGRIRARAEHGDAGRKPRPAHALLVYEPDRDLAPRPGRHNLFPRRSFRTSRGSSSPRSCAATSTGTAVSTCTW